MTKKIDEKEETNMTTKSIIEAVLADDVVALAEAFDVVCKAKTGALLEAALSDGEELDEEEGEESEESDEDESEQA